LQQGISSPGWPPLVFSPLSPYWPHRLTAYFLTSFQQQAENRSHFRNAVFPADGFLRVVGARNAADAAEHDDMSHFLQPGRPPRRSDLQMLIRPWFE